MTVDLTRHFANLADDASRSPFTAMLSQTIAQLPEIAELLASAPPEQQNPVLLLAALHEQVLAEPDCDLAAWYPSVTDAPRTGDITAALLAHCRAHASALRSTLATRHTQTNEVGRCGVVLPVLGMVAAEVGPVALVDVGTSAGLNLHLDRYSYDYAPGGRVGPASDVHLHITTEGDVPVPTEVPEVRARIGIDPAPVDPTDDTATRWLRACIWPDQHDRFERFDAALDIARRQPADVRRADAVGGIAAAVADAAVRAHPVVMNSWVLNYLSSADRRAYVDRLDTLGAAADLSWVFVESPAVTSGLPYPDHLRGRHGSTVQLVRWRDGVRRVDHLASCHPHGYWLHWAS